MSNTNRDIEDCRSTLERYYEKGLNDAWELARKISHYTSYGLLDRFEVAEVMCVFDEYTYQEAYEKANEIKVGDIVYNDDTMENGIVTYIVDNEAFMLYDDGSCGLAKGNLTKTGKHIDLTNILKQIGGTE